MSTLDNMKIGTKVIGGYLIIALLLVVVAVVGYWNMQGMNQGAVGLYQDRLLPIQYIGAVRADLLAMRGDIFRMFFMPEAMTQLKAAIEKNKGKVNESITKYDDHNLLESEKLSLEAFNKAWADYQVAADGVVRKLENNDQTGAKTDVSDGGAAAVARGIVDKALNDLIAANVSAGEEAFRASNDTFASASKVLGGTALIGVLIALVIGFFLSSSITRPLAQGVQMMLEMAKGHLGMRLKMNRKDEVGILAKAMDEFSEDLQKNVVATLQKIAVGDVSANAVPKDGQDEITPALVEVLSSLRGLISETNNLSQAAVDGKLSTRGDVHKFQGGYQEIIKGVNDCLDAVINPLNMAANYVDQISKGVIPPKVTDSYNGDFNIIKNNLNTCIDGLGGLVEADEVLKCMAANDYTHTIQGKYLGVFDEVAIAVSGVQDRIKHVTGTLVKISEGDLTDLNAYRQLGNGTGRRSENDRLAPAMIKMMESLQALVDDANTLARATLDGRLDVRADVSKHSGDYQRVIQGVNDTLDAVVNPLKMAANYMERISRGDIPPRITESYNGEFDVIKGNLNTCVDTLQWLIEEDGGRALQAASDRDLTKRVERQYQGAFDLMKNNINMVLQTLDEALAQVAAAVEQVNDASGQINTGSQMLAEGANEQASSLEEVSASLEEMASTTRQNAGNANHAKQLSNDSRSSAEKGNAAMERMSEAINKIKTSSDETAKIVKTIDEIAFQTNLLALNAAVEAARAGDAGKGFAVVAEEVRNLAQRSAAAAKNTADLIDESVKNSQGGVEISLEVARILNEIVDGSAKVSDVIAEIAAASDEQSKGIEQVNTAVAQMNTVTQQNAANSEESAAAAEELRGQAEELASMVASFTISNTGGGVVERPGLVRPAMKSAKAQQLSAATPTAGVKSSGPNGHGPKSVVRKPGNQAGMSRIGKATRSSKPEAVIPLDDDDLRDF